MVTTVFAGVVTLSGVVTVAGHGHQAMVTKTMVIGG